jgi:hypothetical protein
METLPVGTRQHNTALLQRAALDLRKGGKSYGEIAELMGVKRVRAYRLVKAALLKIIKEPAEDVLQLELERLDQLLEAVWFKALSSDPLAINSALRIMERRAKLLGLDKAREALVSLTQTTDNSQTQVNIDWTVVIQESPEILEAIKRSLNTATPGPTVELDSGGSKVEFRDLPFIRRKREMEEIGPPDPTV